MTLGEMNEQIVGYGKELDMDIELFHSNVEGEVINALYEAHDSGYEAGIINPAGYTTTPWSHQSSYRAGTIPDD
ncbi:MAG: hypothetical protein CM1200mP22_28070 [Dehalococcoidia bacterium]|nr:MAG: hypothetical protein CM1200mP22_28070 [Dehalococcoidia bacterium]